MYAIRSYYATARRKTVAERRPMGDTLPPCPATAESVQTVNQPQPSFYFHDYETFGVHPGRDRPAQFAGIRTDAELNLIV